MNNRAKEWRKERHADALQAYQALMEHYPLSVDNLAGEYWCDIGGCELYQVSNFGRVKSFAHGTVKILKPQLNTKGYLDFKLCISGKLKHCSVHRLVAQAFISNLEGKTQVNHIDGHPLNCHVSNLEWCTNLENRRHAFRTGLNKMGAEHHLAKLTTEQIQYIRMNPDNLSQQSLGSMFGVSKSAVGKIRRGQTYKNLPAEINPTNLRHARKIPDDQRAEIRKTFKSRDPQYGASALAKKYDVTTRTIYTILSETV